MVSQAEMVLQRIHFPAWGTPPLRHSLQSSHLTAATEALTSHLLLALKWWLDHSPASGTYWPGFPLCSGIRILSSWSSTLSHCIKENILQKLLFLKNKVADTTVLYEEPKHIGYGLGMIWKCLEAD